jgi:tetratricopeptide (TPR) repeat protein
MSPHIKAILITVIMTLSPCAYPVDTSEPPGAASDPDYAAGRKAIQEKDWQRAVTLLNKAAQKDPRNADIHNNLGFAYRHTKQLPLAFKHYELALSIDPDHRGAHEYIGEAYLMVNDLPKAEEHRAKLERLCFFPCEELTDLRAKIAAYKKNVK